MKPLNLFIKGLAAAALLIGASQLAACATPADPTAMTVSSASIAPTQPSEPGYKQFRVSGVEGGRDTNPLWVSDVSNKDFQTALEASLKAANYLADEADKATAEINANMIALKQPFAGLDMSVTTQVKYTAKDAKTNTVMYDDTVAATGTATVGQALIGVERLKLANEAAVRANIEAFIQRLRDKLAGK